MGTLPVDLISDEAGTGAPDFPNGLTQSGGAPVGGGGPTYAEPSAGCVCELHSLNFAHPHNVNLALPTVDGTNIGSTIRVMKRSSGYVTISSATSILAGACWVGNGASPTGGFAEKLEAEYIAVDQGGAAYAWIAIGTYEGEP